MNNKVRIMDDEITIEEKSFNKAFIIETEAGIYELIKAKTFDEFCLICSEYGWFRLFQKSLQDKSLFRAAVKRFVPYEVIVFIIPLISMLTEKIINNGTISSFELNIENLFEKNWINPISKIASGFTKIEIKGINREIDNTSVNEFIIEKTNKINNCFFLLVLK